MKSFLLQDVVEKVTRAEFVTFWYTVTVMSSSYGLLLGIIMMGDGMVIRLADTACGVGGRLAGTASCGCGGSKC